MYTEWRKMKIWKKKKQTNQKPVYVHFSEPLLNLYDNCISLYKKIYYQVMFKV